MSSAAFHRCPCLNRAAALACVEARKLGQRLAVVRGASAGIESLRVEQRKVKSINDVEIVGEDEEFRAIQPMGDRVSIGAKVQHPAH